MMTRREAICLLGSVPVGAWFAAPQVGLNFSIALKVSAAADNGKQLGLGNIFDTRVWLLPENQKNSPCYVVVPQTEKIENREG